MKRNVDEIPENNCFRQDFAASKHWSTDIWWITLNECQELSVFCFAVIVKTCKLNASVNSWRACCWTRGRNFFLPKLPYPLAEVVSARSGFLSQLRGFQVVLVPAGFALLPVRNVSFVVSWPTLLAFGYVACCNLVRCSFHVFTQVAWNALWSCFTTSFTRVWSDLLRKLVVSLRVSLVNNHWKVRIASTFSSPVRVSCSSIKWRDSWFCLKSSCSGRWAMFSKTFLQRFLSAIKSRLHYAYIGKRPLQPKREFCVC